MNDILLTTVDDLKEVTSISKNIQSELLEPYLLVAEEFFVYPILGDALVSEFKNQLTGNTLSDLNKTLLIQYVRPVVGYGAWHEYIPFSYVKSTQKGEVSQFSDNSSTPAIDIVSYKRQALKDKLSFFQDRLKKYLEDNHDMYPLYRSTCRINNNNYSSSIYLGDAN